MFLEKDFFIGLRDLEKWNKLSNTSLLSYLEDIGGIHSNIAGYGLNDIENVKCSWVLIGWKVKLFSRPKYADTLKIKTWSRKIHKIYAFRDFEIFNQNNERIGIATSKWILVNIETGKISKIEGEIGEKYKPESVKMFEEEDLEKLLIPDNFSKECDFKITKNLIDVNNHVHNIYYLDIAKEVIPEEVFEKNSFNSFEIMYKKEIKYGEVVKCLFSEEEDYCTVVIKGEEDITHSIIRLYKNENYI